MYEDPYNTTYTGDATFVQSRLDASTHVARENGLSQCDVIFYFYRQLYEELRVNTLQ